MRWKQFEVAGISADARRNGTARSKRRPRVNEARMDMALGNVDQQKIKIEEEAEKLQASRTGEAIQESRWV
jgi:hypothetical protein